MLPRPPMAPTPLGCSRRLPPEPAFSLLRLGEDPDEGFITGPEDLRFSFLLALDFLAGAASSSLSLLRGLLSEVLFEDLLLLEPRCWWWDCGGCCCSYDEGCTTCWSRFSIDLEFRLDSMDRDWKNNKVSLIFASFCVTFPNFSENLSNWRRILNVKKVSLIFACFHVTFQIPEFFRKFVKLKGDLECTKKNIINFCVSYVTFQIPKFFRKFVKLKGDLECK